MKKIPLGRQFGNEVNATADEALRRLQVKQMHGQIWTAEPAVVWDYDFEKQRVDLILRNHPGTLPVKNIPISGTGGTCRVIRPLNTAQAFLKDRSKPHPDVGVLLYMRSDSTKSWVKDKGDEDLQIHAPTPLTHGKLGGVFVPAVHLQGDDLPSVMGTDIQKDDFALVHSTGASVVIKADGSIVLNPASGKEVKVGTEDLAAAYQGDSTATDVAALKTDFNSLLAKLRASGAMKNA